MPNERKGEVEDDHFRTGSPQKGLLAFLNASN